MATTHRSTWKARERQAAAIFGSRRQRCSGSSGRDDCSRSDSTHERLFIETKLRAGSATISMFDETRALARKESKMPVLMLARKGRPGLLLVIDPNDLAAVAKEFAMANAPIPADTHPPDDWPPLAGRSAETDDFALASLP